MATMNNFTYSNDQFCMSNNDNINMNMNSRSSRSIIPRSSATSDLFDITNFKPVGRNNSVKYNHSNNTTIPTNNNKVPLQRRSMINLDNNKSSTRYSHPISQQSNMNIRINNSNHNINMKRSPVKSINNNYSNNNISSQSLHRKAIINNNIKNNNSPTHDRHTSMINSNNNFNAENSNNNQITRSNSFHNLNASNIGNNKNNNLTSPNNNKLSISNYSTNLSTTSLTSDDLTFSNNRPRRSPSRSPVRNTFSNNYNNNNHGNNNNNMNIIHNPSKNTIRRSNTMNNSKAPLQLSPSRSPVRRNNTINGDPSRASIRRNFINNDNNLNLDFNYHYNNNNRNNNNQLQNQNINSNSRSVGSNTPKPLKNGQPLPSPIRNKNTLPLQNHNRIININNGSHPMNKDIRNSTIGITKPLTPYQIQRQQMQTKFQFPNGEQFTPRPKVNANEPFVFTNNATTPTTQVPSINVTTPNNTIEENKQVKRTGSKKFGSFFKRLFSSKDDSTVPKENGNKPVVSTNLTVPSPSKTTSHNNTNNNIQVSNLNINTSIDYEQDFDSAHIIERLQKQWNTVHENDSFSSHSSKSIHSSNHLNNSTHSSTSCKNERTVKFADEIFVNETYAADEYDRTEMCDDAESGNILPTDINNMSSTLNTISSNTSKYGEKLVFDKEFGFVNEIKFELNQFKREEMIVHVDSIKFTHFLK